jgi:hypothetical protein
MASDHNREERAITRRSRSEMRRASALRELAALITCNRPALKAAAIQGDGVSYGLVWRLIEDEAERLGLADDLAAWRSCLSPDALRSERGR